MEGWADVSNNTKTKVLVVCGPTATGKSSLALHLARRFGGELIAADSMQVYRGLVVGTAATTPQAAGEVPVHLTGFLPPEQPFSVADWVEKAAALIEGISARGRLPIVCGGTGLYIQSLVTGTRFEQDSRDDALRAELEAQWQAQGANAMLARLAALDPRRAETLHVKDKKRILRALEQSLLTGRTAAQRLAASRPAQPPYDSLLLGLRFEEREMLYNSINLRVDAMMAQGLLAEAQTVWENRARYQTAAQAIGYKEFFPYFEGTSELGACVDKLKQATRNYAKRQLTWFGGMTDIHWLEADDPDLAAKAETLMEGRRARGTGPS